MKTCDKRQYTKKEAQTAINARRKGRKCPPNLRAYQCPNCDLWHLTKQAKTGDS